MDNIFKQLEPILSKTENWRAKSFQKFWVAALRYACNGEIPTFVDDEGKDVHHLSSTFDEFKAIIDKDKPDVPTTPVETPAPASTLQEKRNWNVLASKAGYQELINNLGEESTFFTDVERCILMDMLNECHKRKGYLNTPFCYTSRRVGNIGMSFEDLSTLRDALIMRGIMTCECRKVEGFEYALTFYTIDEVKLSELVKANIVDNSKKAM